MDKSQKYYNKALEYYQKGYIERALEYCEKSISLNIKNKAAIDLKGILYYLKGELNQAKALWKLNSRENDDSVAEKYLEGIEKDEERFKLYVKAVKLVQNVEIIKALEILQKCAESDYNSINVNNYLCVCYMKIGDFESAINSVEKVLTIDINNEIALENKKNLMEYGVIKANNKPKKIFFVIGIIGVCLIFMYSVKIIKSINNKFELRNSPKVSKIITNKKKPNKKVESKVDEEQQQQKVFPYNDFENALSNKDFETLYNYSQQWKNENLNINDKVLLSQGENLLKNEGTIYFYKKATGFYISKDYTNATNEYLKAYQYGDNSYLMPDIIYFIGSSFQNINDYENALKYYSIYDSSYGKGDYEQTVLYEMSIISKDVDINKAKEYAKRLSNEYPKSIYSNSNIKSIIDGNN
jgi:tetratricopeptide (TPR) repeat protein